MRLIPHTKAQEMSSDDLIDLGDSVSEKQEIVETNDFVYVFLPDGHAISVTEEPEEVVVEEKKEDSEAMKSLKKGAGLVGGFFKKGWGAVKSGASKANEKFKETEVCHCSLEKRRLQKSTSSSRRSLRRKWLREAEKLVLPSRKVRRKQELQ